MKPKIALAPLALFAALATSLPALAQEPTEQEVQQELWRTDQKAAFAEAQRRVAEAQAEGAGTLRLSGLAALADLPPELVALGGIHTLDLQHLPISDLSPLSGLTGLRTLYLGVNTAVTDLAPLSGLTGLIHLQLTSTHVTDLSPLSGLTGLERLFLDDTTVVDLTPVAGLTGLDLLSLSPIPRSAI